MRLCYWAGEEPKDGRDNTVVRPLPAHMHWHNTFKAAAAQFAAAMAAEAKRHATSVQVRQVHGAWFFGMQKRGISDHL